jgi:hypothetical protein
MLAAGALALAAWTPAFAGAQEDAVAAFKADPAVQAALGTPSDQDEFEATLLSKGGEMPYGTHTPFFTDIYLVVARQPAYTPHGFYQKNTFGEVYILDGAVKTVRLVELRPSMLDRP